MVLLMWDRRMNAMEESYEHNKMGELHEHDVVDEPSRFYGLSK